MCTALLPTVLLHCLTCFKYWLDSQSASKTGSMINVCTIPACVEPIAIVLSHVSRHYAVLEASYTTEEKRLEWWVHSAKQNWNISWLWVWILLMCSSTSLKGWKLFNISFPTAVALSSFWKLCVVRSGRIGLVESKIRLLVSALERNEPVSLAHVHPHAFPGLRTANKK